MMNETFDLDQVAEVLGGLTPEREDLTRSQLKHRRRKLSNFLDPHELHGERNKVYIDPAGLKILKEAEEIYQGDQAPYINISDLDEFQETAKKIEEEHNVEVTLKKGEQGIEQLEQQLQSEREKSTQLSQQLQKKDRKLETLQQQKQTMEKVRDSIIERLARTDSVGKEGLNAIMTALGVLQQARISLEKRTGLTPK